MNLPNIPYSFKDFTSHLEAAKTRDEVNQVLEPFKTYEAKLRQIYAQEPDHDAVSQDHLVPIYQAGKADLKNKARNVSSETKDEREKFLLPLSNKQRRKEGTGAITSSLKEFQKNFNVFSESALVDLDWSNIVAAGSSVVTPLLPAGNHGESKRTLRTYYHEQLAPASDVDLFIYGLNEEQAIEKIKQIEAQIRDAVLSETTVVRTKNAITIVSEYPIRHIQIVLRLYKSVSEILTGFDVDCSCVAYDGNQVWASPRALAAFALQTNSIDLTRRSPSYENRLSKYSHRGFEVYWPNLDRSRVDPTIYERAFNRVLGLARLLVLEKLPHPEDRDQYLNKRRTERGRPELPWNSRYGVRFSGNVKDAQPDDIAEWNNEDDLSSYHSFTIPWGPRYRPKKIERLLFQQDLLKNAEWNKSKDREANLHRHPAFFGRVEDVIHDCCGYCPKPVTDADLAAWEEESKIFVSGDISFLKDDPGRQEIGSFHPLTDDDWTDMAYVGSTGSLCQAIVNKDLEGVLDWFKTEGADVNKRDHTGRTPLHLAVICSSPEIVQCLIDHRARLVARLYNGLTALHLAAWRGSAEMVKALLEKSAQNEIEEDAKEEKRKQARREAFGDVKADQELKEDTEMKDVADENASDSGSNDEEIVDAESDSGSDDRMTGSFVKVDSNDQSGLEQEKEDDPDVYDIDVTSWDTPCSALHLAILGGHRAVIDVLVDNYGADVMLPIKLMTNSTPREPRGAIMSLLLPLNLPLRSAIDTIKQLIEKGASPLQATTDHVTVLHFLIDQAKIQILRSIQEIRPDALTKSVKSLIVPGYSYGWNSDIQYPLLSAIRSGSVQMVKDVLSLGAKPSVDLEDFASAYNSSQGRRDLEPEELKNKFCEETMQPIIEAAYHDNMTDIVLELVKLGADVNTLTARSWPRVLAGRDRNYHGEDKALLDVIRDRCEELEKFATPEGPQDEKDLKPPESLQDDEHYLKDLSEGSYKYWSATKDLETAKFIQNERTKKYQGDLEARRRKPKLEPKDEQKRKAAKELAQKYRSIADELVKAGAKTFLELYPHLKEKHKLSEDNSDDESGDEDGGARAYKTRFEFAGQDVTPSKQERYLQLFEAVFAGDTDTVKSMCLSGDDSSRPLLVSVTDHNGFNPFTIAALRGHLELARVILDIAAAQYRNPDDDKRTQVYSLSYDERLYEEELGDSIGMDTEGEDLDEYDEPRFFKKLTSEKFTIDDIDALAKNVKSTTRPLSLFNTATFETWRAFSVDRTTALQQCRIASKFDPTPHFWYYEQKKEKQPWRVFGKCWSEEKSRTAIALTTYATVTNNPKLLKFLLEMEVRYSTEEPEDLLKSLAGRDSDLEFAMNLGYLDIIDTLIRHRGLMLPLHHLAKRSGVIVEEVPKYYQGLSVYGQKRKDWANQERFSVDTSESASPVLNAIVRGNLDVIDYFESHTPLRRYEEFCSRFSKDQRIRALSESEGGVTTALRSWMGTRMNLVLHMAVMAWPAGSSKILRYLLERTPSQYLEVRSQEGDTPLHLAFKLGNMPACEILLTAGADQKTRDKKGYNLLHTIYSNADENELALFKKCISMLDQKNIPGLLEERCSGIDPGLLSPLALYLRNSSSDSEKSFELLDYMLELSGGKDLTIMDGAGDHPLHFEVRRQLRGRAIHLAEKRPDIVYYENATGMTPLQVAETSYFSDRLSNAPSLRSSGTPSTIADGHDHTFDKFMSQKSREDGSNDDGSENHNLSNSVSIYKDLMAVAKENPQPRRLVSVLSANDVARRLAGQEQRKLAENRRRQAQGLKDYNRSRYYPNDQDNDEDDGNSDTKPDEIKKWIGTANTYIRQLPFNRDADTEKLETQLQRWRDLADGKIDSWRCCEKADSKDLSVREKHKKVTKEVMASTY